MTKHAQSGARPPRSQRLPEYQYLKYRRQKKLTKWKEGLRLPNPYGTYTVRGITIDTATAIDPIRNEFERFTKDHPLFDGRNISLLMTEARPESVELRLSMSAKTIGDLWNLRCAVREHMLDWLRREKPDALIRHRLEVEAANQRASG